MDDDGDEICDSANSLSSISESFDFLPLTINKPPIVQVINPVPAEPQPAGINITWACKASDSTGDLLRYMFRMRGPSTNDTWTTMRGYRKGRKWIWQTTPDDIGETDVKCVVKDYPAHNKATRPARYIITTR
jgi:hypothetical protein